MHTYQKRILSNTFTEVIPYHKYQNHESGWRDGMISGNGENGVVCSCSPYSETLTYQNIFLTMPSIEPRFTPPEVTGELHEARQAVIHFDDSWNVHDRKRTFLYCYHPGHQIRLKMQQLELLDYERQTDFEKAEIKVNFRDEKGLWTRRTFTSREDNVTITEITQSDLNKKINLTISIDDLSSIKKFGDGDEVNLQYKKLVAEDCSYISLVAHYPAYEGSELAEGGYVGITRVIAIGGTIKKIFESAVPETINVGVDKNPALSITDADAVYLISKCERTYTMGNLSDFASTESYHILDRLIEDTEEVKKKYSGECGCFSYDQAMEPHAQKQRALFNTVKFSLGSDTYKNLYNEELIDKQKSCDNLYDAFVERVYNQARYAMICNAGSSAPRLCGLWTGEWNPGWRGAYTMDANVNIEVAGMNTGNIYDEAVGYIYFILKQIPDWEDNAKMTYGMKDAIQVPVNTDGDRAIMVEYDEYFPFQYWNAGASWMLLPIFEFWQCYGNCKIPVNHKILTMYQQDYLDLERDILLPLLTKQANFWKQLCTSEYYTDINGKACYQRGKKELMEGERYLIIPSYSPENKPEGYKSTITANASMDISAAKDGLLMTIALEKAITKEGYIERILEWEMLLSKLPDYKYDSTGALCEWAMSEYKENNAHRHISHLYCAWPAYETHNHSALSLACKTAIENRNRENKGIDDTASHGWVHKALVAARLKDSQLAYSLLHVIMTSNIYYSSLMTDHNTDRSFGVYCTDTSYGTIGIINEMLIYSYTGEIEFFPALPKEWLKGSVSGMMARTNAEITKLEWDIEKGIIVAKIKSRAVQTIKISSKIGSGNFVTASGQTYKNSDRLMFDKNEEIELEFFIKDYCI